jgi:hypothetical protein
MRNTQLLGQIASQGQCITRVDFEAPRALLVLLEQFIVNSSNVQRAACCGAWRSFKSPFRFKKSTEMITL